MKKCCYAQFRNGPIDKHYCVDACEDCKYFLDGTETKSITIRLENIPIEVSAADLIEEIELSYEAAVVGSVDYLDIEFVEERMN